MRSTAAAADTTHPASNRIPAMPPMVFMAHHRNHCHRGLLLITAAEHATEHRTDCDCSRATVAASNMATDRSTCNCAHSGRHNHFSRVRRGGLVYGRRRHRRLAYRYCALDDDRLLDINGT